MYLGEPTIGNSKTHKRVIDAAILGFEEQKRRLEAQIADLRALRNGSRQTESTSGRRRRRMSAASRKAIAEAQRKDGLL
jgi:hypothetical protein